MRSARPTCTPSDLCWCCSVCSLFMKSCEMWGDLGRSGEMQGDLGRCGVLQRVQLLHKVLARCRGRVRIRVRVRARVRVRVTVRVKGWG